MLRVVIALLLALAIVTHPVPARAERLTVFAAASLKGALDEIAAAFNDRSDHRAVVSFAGSSALARQIEAGAPADVFISANTAWMDRLEERSLIRSETRIDLLGNRLVLVAHGQDPEPLELEPGVDLAARLGDQRLAMALVEAVPAGIYGKEALQSLGVWGDVAPRVAQASNVRGALALVALGEASYGVVYATDAAAEDAVSVVGTFPRNSHQPIVYPAAQTSSAPPAAARFMEFLQSPPAAAIFERHGFTVLS